MSARYQPTRGPWSTDGHFIKSKGGTIIAECFSTKLAAEGFDERGSNARVMAGASEMMELLEVVAELSPAQFPEAAKLLARIKGGA